MDMMKKNMVMVVPQMAMMGWVSYFFSGFIVGQLTFLFHLCTLFQWLPTMSNCCWSLAFTLKLTGLLHTPHIFGVTFRDMLHSSFLIAYLKSTIKRDLCAHTLGITACMGTGKLPFPLTDRF